MDKKYKSGYVFNISVSESAFFFTPVHKEDYTISEEFREKIAKAREDYKAGKGVTCKTIEQSMSLLESL